MIPCSPSSLSGTSMMLRLLCFTLSQRPLKLSSFLKLFISFWCSGWVFFLPCLPNCWFNPLFHPTYCLFLPVFSSFQILYSSWFIFFMVAVSVFLLVSILTTMTLNSVWMICLLPFHCALLLEISPVLSSGACFLVPPIWMPVGACLYELGISSTSLSLPRVAFCCRCPVKSVHSLLDYLSWVLQKCPLCGSCGPSFCNWVLNAVGPLMHGVSPQADWLWGLSQASACELLGRMNNTGTQLEWGEDFDLG